MATVRPPIYTLGTSVNGSAPSVSWTSNPYVSWNVNDSGGIAKSGGRPVGTVSAPAGGYGSNAINFPEQADYQSFLPSIQRNLDSVVPKVTSVPGLGDDYWDSLFNSSQKRLNQDYFGAGGQDEQVTEQLASRGLLGDSLEFGTHGARTELRNKFADSLGEVQQDINRAQQEAAVNESLERRRLDQQRGLTLGELGLRSALTQASEANKFGLGRFETESNIEQNNSDSRLRERQQLLDFLTSPEVSIDEGQQSAILDALFPSVLGSGSRGGSSAPAAANPYGTNYNNTGFGNNTQPLGYTPYRTGYMPSGTKALTPTFRQNYGY